MCGRTRKKVFEIITYQDMLTAVEKGKVLTFLRDSITQHRNSDNYKTAVAADEYDHQRNTTIRETVRRIYSLTGKPMEDFTASNNRIASNFFRRLNVQRCTYSLGNGVTFDEDGVKDKLGDSFDTDLYNAGYKALIHGISFGFWNLDKLHVFAYPEFVPFWDEETGALRAGLRYWCLDWNKKPLYAVLYEEDGFTKYRSKGGRAGLTLEEYEPKRAYRQTIAHTDAGGDEVIGEDNYTSLPIVPFWGSNRKQSTLVGMREAIDSYDLIQSGFANDVNDCAQIYWLISGAMGMEDDDVQQFMDRLRLQHAAVADTSNDASVTAFTQEPPYNAREAYLDRIERSIYRDFGAFNPMDITSRQATATEINAAYQPMDEEADDFEYQCIEFVQQILKLQGIEATPTFKRNRISNQTEQVNMIMSQAEVLDVETMLELFPNITTDMIPEILARRAAENADRTPVIDDGDEA